MCDVYGPVSIIVTRRMLVRAMSPTHSGPFRTSCVQNRNCWLVVILAVILTVQQGTGFCRIFATELEDRRPKTVPYLEEWVYRTIAWTTAVQLYQDWLEESCCKDSAKPCIVTAGSLGPLKAKSSWEKMH